MLKVVIKYLILVFLLISSSYAQDELQDIELKVKNNPSIIQIDDADKTLPVNRSEERILENPDLVLNKLRTPPPQPFSFEFPKSLITSFNSNFHFAGFWGKYAVINVTPQMYIKPFEFISIYANHSTSMYIPVAEVKDHFKSLAIEGAAILAVDNSVKLLFSSHPLLQSLISFAAKNLMISVIKKTFADVKVHEFKYYYYAVSIRF